METNKTINVIFLPQAEKFVEQLDKKSKQKLFYSMRKVKERIRGKWFAKLKGTNGIYEFRFDENNKYYRVFAFWDTERDEETLIVNTHGIVKKSNKTSLREIRKAEKIRNEYFDERNL